MSLLTEAQRQLIFQEMQVINGYKHFGAYDHLIVAGHEEVFQRVKSLHSLDVNHPIYHLGRC